MPKVSGASPCILRPATTRASARAVTIGSPMSLSACAAMAACKAGETVMALPFSPRPKAATIGTLT